MRARRRWLTISTAGVRLACLFAVCALLVACPNRFQPPEQSDDADLAALIVRRADDSEVTLAPGFDPGHTSYACTVDDGTQSVTVSAEPEDDEASVAIGGAASPHEVALTAGTTAIGVVVTAEDGTTRTYTIAVTKEAPQPSGIVGPEWPSPAGLAAAAVGTADPDTQPGRAGGLEIAYTVSDLAAVDELWWGLDTRYPPQLSFTGEDGLEAGTLAFVESASDSVTSVWTGTIPLTHYVGGIERTDQVDVRFTMTMLTTGDSFTDASDLLAIDAGFDASMEQLHPVSGSFHVNFFYEAEWNSTWLPAYDFFDDMDTPDEEGLSRHSFGGALYYTPLP